MRATRAGWMSRELEELLSFPIRCPPGVQQELHVLFPAFERTGHGPFLNFEMRSHDDARASFTSFVFALPPPCEQGTWDHVGPLRFLRTRSGMQWRYGVKSRAPGVLETLS